MRRRLLIAALIGATALALAYAASAAWRMHRRAQAEAPILPEFSEPDLTLPAAPRAPTLGVEPGWTDRAAVEALITERGVTCADTSVRALMSRAREAKKEELAAMKARGESVDGVSGASVVDRKSPRERNPQVRLSCLDVPADTLGDRQRPPAMGRWLFVLDSPELPLRHVSYRRMHPDRRAALADLDSAVAAAEAAFGEPAKAPAARPVSADGETPDFPRYRPLTWEWRFRDLRVEVTALDFGRRGVDVLEAAEVPWPVRPDARQRP